MSNDQFIDWLIKDLMSYGEFRGHINSQSSTTLPLTMIKDSPVNKGSVTLVHESNVKAKVKELLKAISLLRSGIFAVCENFVTFDSPQSWINFSDNASLSSPKTSASDAHFLYVLRRQIAVILEDSAAKRHEVNNSTHQCRLIDKLCTATRAANRLLSIFVLRLSKTDLVRLGQQADFATSLRDSLRQLLAALANVKQIDGQDINDLNSAVETFEIEVLLPLQQRKELLEEAAERYMKDLLTPTRKSQFDRKLPTMRSDFKPKGFLSPSRLQLKHSCGMVKQSDFFGFKKSKPSVDRIAKMENQLDKVIQQLDTLQMSKSVRPVARVVDKRNAESQTEPPGTTDLGIRIERDGTSPTLDAQATAAKLSKEIVNEVVDDFCSKLDHICDSIVSEIFREEMIFVGNV